jgi:hypothetical protein
MEQTRSNRRTLLKGAGAAGMLATGGFAGQALAAAQGARHIAGYDERLAPSAQTLNGWLRRLHGFGPIRATGTPQCRAFEEFLAAEFQKLGCEVMRDQFRLTSWECDIKDCSIEVTEEGGRRRKLDVVAYYPFGGSTAGKPAVTGKLLYMGVADGANAEAQRKVAEAIAKVPKAVLAESIAVFDMPLANGGNRGRVVYYPESFPDPLPPPVSAYRVASQGGQAPMAGVEELCRGVILCYTDVSNEAARHNYLPFSDRHRKIPGLWVGKADADYLRSMSGKATATMRCDAKLTPDARADSLLAVMKGQSDEVIYLTTHTDGPNEVNDNGALGLLAVASYWAKVPDRRRTLVFSLPTGHYAGGAVRDPVTGSGRPSGTTGNFAKWPQYVDRAVGQLALEQMGAMEWADVDGKWGPTGRISPENWIPTPAVVGVSKKMFMASTRGEDPRYSRCGLVESGQAPGEGGGLRSRGIPGVGLMGSPHYFFRADPKGVIDKLSARVMKNQCDIAIKMTVLMNRLTVQQMKGDEPLTDRDLFEA